MFLLRSGCPGARLAFFVARGREHGHLSFFVVSGVHILRCLFGFCCAFLFVQRARVECRRGGGLAGGLAGDFSPAKGRGPLADASDVV